VAKDIDWLFAEHLVAKVIHSHIRPPPWPVDLEKRERARILTSKPLLYHVNSQCK
jgi:hypothetical protein